MIRSLDRAGRLTALMFLGLALAVFGSWSLSDASRRAALRAADHYQDCRKLAVRIQRLQTQPTLASDAALSVQEVRRQIDLARQTASIPSDQLDLIDPQRPRRLGETPYLEQATHVALSRVTLQQWATFLHALTHNDSGLNVAQMRLSASRGGVGTGPETWQAEVTLTSLVFSPKTSLPARAASSKSP